MQVAKWGNSLAVRLGAERNGDHLETGAVRAGLHVVGERSLEVARKVSPEALLTRLRRLRGRLPPDFRFDRLEAHEADRQG